MEAVSENVPSKIECDRGKQIHSVPSESLLSCRSPAHLY